MAAILQLIGLQRYTAFFLTYECFPLVLFYVCEDYSFIKLKTENQEKHLIAMLQTQIKVLAYPIG